MNKTSIHLKCNKEGGYKFSTNYSNFIRMWAHGFLQLMPEWMWFSSCADKETLNAVSPSHKNTFCLHSDSRNRTQEAAFTQEILVTIECRWRCRQHGFTSKPPFLLLQPAGTATVQRQRKWVEPLTQQSTDNPWQTGSCTQSWLPLPLQTCRLSFPECNHHTTLHRGMWNMARDQMQNHRKTGASPEHYSLSLAGANKALLHLHIFYCQVYTENKGEKPQPVIPVYFTEKKTPTLEQKSIYCSRCIFYNATSSRSHSIFSPCYPITQLSHFRMKHDKF